MGDPVPSSAISDATTGGLSVIVITGGATGQVLTLQANGTYAPATVSAGIGGSTGATADRVLTASGTGGSTLQASPVGIDSSGNVTGVATITASADIVLTGSPARVMNSSSGTADGIKITSGGINVFRNLDDFCAIDLPSYLGIKLINYLGLCWSSTDAIGGTADSAVYRATGGAVSIRSASGAKIQNFAGDADAALTCLSITLSGAHNLAPITKAALLLLTPTAASAGRWRVTDATPASREAYPDGTNWRYTSDDTVVT